MPFKSNHVYLHSRKYIIVCQETALLPVNMLARGVLIRRIGRLQQ